MVKWPPTCFTFLSHTEYVKRESIIIAWVKKKFSPFDECSCFVCLRRQNKQKKISICLSGCLAVRTWNFHVDTITFEGVSGSKQNLVGVFYVWNVGLVLKSKVISWSWFWTEFWFFYVKLFATIILSRNSLKCILWYLLELSDPFIRNKNSVLSILIEKNF